MDPQERLERYATLFAFTTENDIDVNRLSEQWNVDPRGVASMIRFAKNNANLYTDLRNLYEDSDFPGWWYSPARNTNAAPPSKTDVGAENAGNGEFRAPEPTVGPSIGRGSQRSPLPLRSVAPSSAQLGGSPSGSVRIHGGRGQHASVEEDLSFTG